MTFRISPEARRLLELRDELKTKEDRVNMRAINVVKNWIALAPTSQSERSR